MLYDRRFHGWLAAPLQTLPGLTGSLLVGTLISAALIVGMTLAIGNTLMTTAITVGIVVALIMATAVFAM